MLKEGELSVAEEALLNEAGGLLREEGFAAGERSFAVGGFLLVGRFAVGEWEGIFGCIVSQLPIFCLHIVTVAHTLSHLPVCISPQLPICCPPLVIIAHLFAA